MTKKDRVALRGSLAAFPAQEVLQWMEHHAGDTVVAFELPAGLAVGRGILSVHLGDGRVYSLRSTGFAPQAEGESGAESAEKEDLSPASGDPAAPFLQPRRGTLGAVLIEMKLIEAGQLRYALAMQRVRREKEDPPPLLGEVLQDLDILTPANLEKALMDLALLRFAELFNCRAGSFSVVPGSQPPPYVKIDERVDRLLLRAAHLADELGFGRSPAAGD